jgi:antitoxin (DNA-binding transcriptional repressor) of toxin-antitoxin stability system
MAAIVHISEEEAARDFAGLVDRAIGGEQIVVRREGRDVVMLSPIAAGPEVSTKTLGEVIEGLRRRQAAQGLATLDDDFASDMEKIHRELNVPLDDAKWD